MISYIIETLVFIKIEPTMSEQEKNRQRFYDFSKRWNQAEVSVSSKFFFLFRKKSFLRKSGVENWTKNEKKDFNCSCYGDEEHHNLKSEREICKDRS